jgi:hypothetical protein
MLKKKFNLKKFLHIDKNMTDVEKKSSSWTKALKQWNESNENKVVGKTGKAKFIIPKKGTAEFETVKKISDSIKASQPPKVKRTKKIKEVVGGFRPPTTEGEQTVIPALEPVPNPPKKTRKKKEVVPTQVEDTPKPAPDLDTILKLLGAMKN